VKPTITSLPLAMKIAIPHEPVKGRRGMGCDLCNSSASNDFYYRAALLCRTITDWIDETSATNRPVAVT
jgi:hypothetical protein